MKQPSTEWRERIAPDEAAHLEHVAKVIAGLQRARSAKFGRGRALHRKQLLAATGTRMIHQDLPHDTRHYGEEVGPVGKMDVFPAEQLGVGLVHQRRRRQRVIRTLIPHMRIRDSPEFAIRRFDQLIARFSFAGAHLLQQLRDFGSDASVYAVACRHWDSI